MITLRLFIALVATILTGIANAQVSYTYTGNSFTNASSPYTTAMSISGSFSVGTALSDGTYDLLTGPPVGFQYSFADGLHTFSSLDANDSIPAYFNVVVGGGIITNWSITSFDGQSGATMNSSSTFGDFSEVMGPAAIAVMGTNTSAGVWTSVAAVPEPSSYALLLAGMGLLGWASRRREKHKVATA